MIDFLLFFLIFVVGMLYIAYVISRFLPLRNFTTAGWLLFIIFSSFINLIWYLQFGFEADNLYSLFTLVILIVLFRGTVTFKIFTYMFTIFFTLINESFVRIVIKSIYNIDHSQIASEAYLPYQIGICITQVIVVGIHALLASKNIWPKYIDLGHVKKVLLWTYTLLITLGFAFFGFIQYYLLTQSDSMINVSVQFLYTTLLMVAIIAGGIIITLRQSINAKTVDNKNRMLLKHLNHQLNHYQQLEKSLVETRKIKHDMVNHLSCLKILIDGDDKEAALSLLRQVEDKMNTITRTVETGNNVVDAILNEKNQEAISHDITINFKGQLPNYEFIDWIDLCTIIANSLDNAIEATKCLPNISERKIGITTFIKQNQWFYAIENPTYFVEIAANQIVETSKTDKSLHGFGLINIRESINKHDGHLNYECVNNRFVLETIINLLN